ncbi:MAG: hypothetical protein AAGG51_12970 [Cyanobacteria bacterium P01_G01_bin.54]
MYSHTDLQILDEMLNEQAKIRPQPTSGKPEIILPELNGIEYEVKIRGVPENTIAIKTDKFPIPKTFFNNVRGIWKRADFVIVAAQEQNQFIIYIELKVGKSPNKEIIQQLQGAESVVHYCKKIGQLFWKDNNFLENYHARFISIKQIKLSKRPTRELKNQKLHDRPDNMLQFQYQQVFYFKKLVHKEI